MKLTLKQQRFIQFYDGNATDAAIKAGYNKKTAGVIGYENLRKPYISEAISKRNNKKDLPKILSRKERQEFWSKVVNDEDIDLSIRLRASELMGRSEADFSENIIHSGDLNIQEVMSKFNIMDIIGLKNRMATESIDVQFHN